MLIDGHMHLMSKSGRPDTLLEQLQSVGVDGAAIMSIPPAGYFRKDWADVPDAERLEHLFFWSDTSENLFPLYFIDPVADDAVDQVGRAVDRGVCGFKAMCNTFYPSDERAMKTFQAIADADKPILFHTGILYDDNPSANFNRPGNFETLMNVKGLRFAFAHISWPWCDECLAVYGKFECAIDRGVGDFEMFIDTTPGTPPIYRRDALTKLFTIDFHLTGNVFFGIDSMANDYDVEYTKGLLRQEMEILDELGLDAATRQKYFSDNVLRFLGINR